jgi:hypothetical protein
VFRIQEHIFENNFNFGIHVWRISFFSYNFISIKILEVVEQMSGLPPSLLGPMLTTPNSKISAGVETKQRTSLHWMQNLEG